VPAFAGVEGADAGFAAALAAAARCMNLRLSVPDESDMMVGVDTRRVVPDV
jgi:hypothetical protein